jgi:GTP-binding protein
MKIRSAAFLTSAQDNTHYPGGGLPEVAFVGRSNVGKSSLVNTLLGRHNLVKTSRTPGHTRKLNFFLINETFLFVDCPGYGYAAVPLEIKKQWGPMMETYFQEREELAGVVVVVDARLPLTEADEGMVRLVQSHSLPLIIAATKADKLPYGKRLQRVRDLRLHVDESVPVVVFSSHDGLGKNELWKAVKMLIQ